MTSRLVIVVRVSYGHLCGAEAPTEPAGETAERRVAIRSTPLVIASTERCAAIRSFAKGEADFHGRFAEVSAGHPLPRNDKTFCRCIKIRRAVIPSFTCHCEHRKARGNPFSFKGNTDSFTLRVQNDKPISCCECHGMCSKLSLCHCERRKACSNPYLP